MEQIQDKRQSLDASKSTPGEDEEQYSSNNTTRSARHNKSVLKKVKDKAKKLKASITHPNKQNHDDQTETEGDQYDHYSKADNNSSEDKKSEITHDISGKELPEKRLDEALQPEIDWSSPGAYTRAKGFGPRSGFRNEVYRVRSHEETARAAAGEEPVTIAPLPASVQAINTRNVLRQADQSLDATPYKEKNEHFLDSDTDNKIQKLSLGSDNDSQSVKGDGKRQILTDDGGDTGITGKIFDTASTIKSAIFSKIGYESVPGKETAR